LILLPITNFALLQRQEGYFLFSFENRKIQKGGVLMSNYESTFICSPEIPTEKIDEIIEKIKKIVDTSEGKIAVTQQLGRKRLAYPIKKFREGNYVYMELTGPGSLITSLENFFKVNDSVIRYLTVKVEKKKAPKAAAKPAPAQQPVAEEVKANESTNQPETPRAE
jgi:small subunit ribosomal protein S6